VDLENALAGDFFRKAVPPYNPVLSMRIKVGFSVVEILGRFKWDFLDFILCKDLFWLFRSLAHLNCLVLTFMILRYALDGDSI